MQKECKSIKRLFVSWISLLLTSSWRQGHLCLLILPGSPVRSPRYRHWVGTNYRSLFSIIVWCSRYLVFRRSGRRRWSCLPCFCSCRVGAGFCLFWCECLGSSWIIGCGIFSSLLVSGSLWAGNLFRGRLVVVRFLWWLKWNWRLDFWRLLRVGSMRRWTSFFLTGLWVSRGWRV